MDTDVILRVAQQALVLALLLSAPAVLAAAAAGLLVSLLQGAMRLEDHTVAAAPKIAAVALVLAVAGVWMLRQLLVFGQSILEAIASVR